MRLFRGLSRHTSPIKRHSNGPQSTGTRSRFDTDWRSYDAVAEDYARLMAPRMALPAQDVVEVAGVEPGFRILDVGTGTGVCARAAAVALDSQGIVVGIDISLEMAQAARREGGGPVYAAATAIDLPFRDATFNRVFSCFSITHFPRYETALFDMLRVLAPDGRMGIAVWGPGQDMFSQAWREVAEQFVERRLLDDAIRRALPWDEYFSDAGRLKDALYQAGLREIQVAKRDYRFEMTREQYLAMREITATGRFIREMAGERLWETFRRRARDLFAERFPERFNDFRDVFIAVGTRR